PPPLGAGVGARPPPPPPSPPRRSFLFTVAVAQRRLGAISSATISTTERFSPCSVSQLRCSSRPVTTTRVPFPIDSATFSAISRQHTTLRKLVCSSHSFVWRFCQRRLTATENDALAAPPAVYRISGSRVTLPTIVTELSAIADLP